MKIKYLFLFFIISLQATCAEMWVNWLGNQSCQPCRYCEPKTFQELVDNIKDGALQNQNVRAIGNGYSITDMGCTDGYLINLKHLNQILFIDLENKQACVEAGISIK